MRVQSQQPTNILSGKGTVIDKISHIAFGQKPIGFELGSDIIAAAVSKNPLFEGPNVLNEYGECGAAFSFFLSTPSSLWPGSCCSIATTLRTFDGVHLQ